MNTQALILDDAASFGVLLEEFVNAHGEHARAVTSIDAARRMIDLEPLDVLWLDIHLKDGDGIMFLAEIKASHPSLPVIMITGMGYREDLMRDALDLGADGFLSKSQPPSQVLMEIHRVMRTQGARTRRAA